MHAVAFAIRGLDAPRFAGAQMKVLLNFRANTGATLVNLSWRDFDRPGKIDSIPSEGSQSR